MKRSIVFLMPDALPQKFGGMEIQTFKIARSLSSRNWHVTFIATTMDRQKIGTMMETDGMVFYWVRRSRFIDVVRRDILRLIKSIQPSFLYQRGRSNLTASLIGYRCNRSGMVTVYHFAEDNDFVFDFFTQQFRRETRLRKLAYFLTPIFMLKDRMFRLTMQNASAVFAQTEQQRSLCQRRLHRSAHWIRSVIEVTDIEKPKTPLPEVLWIAHAGRRKQLEIFVQLAKALQNERARFVIGGTIPDAAYRHEIEESMTDLPNIVHVGPLSWEESQQWFSRASVFVNTTLPDREGFPNTYLQAWAHKVPVVTLHCDPDNLLEDRAMGFHSRSFDQLVDHVRLLINDSALRETMGDRARRYVTEHHHIDIVSAEIDRVFAELLTNESR